MIRKALITIAALMTGTASIAEEVAVAVASNFLVTAEELSARFETETGHSVLLSHGATGALFAQIVSGAPFDIFLSADAARPAALLEGGQATAVDTYAIGKLVLVGSTEIDAGNLPATFAGRRVALADPMTAPYGLAAVRSMERMGLDTATFQPLIVANVGQVAALFSTGNAELAFVSVAQLPLLDPSATFDLDGLHPPILQDGAFLARAAENPAAAAFWEFLTSETAREIIAAAGFDLDK